MADFQLCQGDTKTVNYTLDGVNILFSDVFFVFGDRGTVVKIKCIPQSVTSPDFKRWSVGGVAIPFTEKDLQKGGNFPAQFIIVDKMGNQTTYPQTTRLLVDVKASLSRV